MLALSRSTRAAHTLRLHARAALSTVGHRAATTNIDAEQLSYNHYAPDDQSAAATHQVQTQVAHSGDSECLYVSPWDGIRSSAEGLAIARAVQNKYGAPAKEVVFLRDIGSVNIFQPYFWLVFDDPNVRRRLPEREAQITVHVPDFPRSDGNIGVEEMMRGLGLSTTDSNDPHHHAPPSPHPTETEPSQNVSDAPPPAGYKSLDVLIEWSATGPAEVQKRKRKRLAAASLPGERQLSRFATAWLAFDGFSPESARGPHTLNLSRAHEKWSRFAPPASDKDVDSVTAAEVPSSSQGIAEEVEEEDEGFETETTAEDQEDEILSREWVPIISSSNLAQQPRPASSVPQNNNDDTSATTAPDGPPFITSLTADTAADDTTDATPAPAPAGMDSELTRTSQGHKLSRRERILQLARQNARTPLPKLAEMPQPPPPPPLTEVEKLDEVESEQQGKERTIRERLWRLVGGNY